MHSPESHEWQEITTKRTLEVKITVVKSLEAEVFEGAIRYNEVVEIRTTRHRLFPPEKGNTDIVESMSTVDKASSRTRVKLDAWSKILDFKERLTKHPCLILFSVAISGLFGLTKWGADLAKIWEATTQEKVTSTEVHGGDRTEPGYPAYELSAHISTVVTQFKASTFNSAEASRAVFRSKQAVLLHYQTRESFSNGDDVSKAIDQSKAIGETYRAIERERPLVPTIQKILEVTEILKEDLIKLGHHTDFPQSKHELLYAHLKDLEALRSGYAELAKAILNCESFWKDKYSVIKACETWDYAKVFTNIVDFAQSM